MFAAAFTDFSALFGVFVVLKTLYGLSVALPSGSRPGTRLAQPRDESPAERSVG